MKGVSAMKFSELDTAVQESKTGDGADISQLPPRNCVTFGGLEYRTHPYKFMLSET